MIEENYDKIMELQKEIESLKSKIADLKGKKIIDTKRLMGIDWLRYTALSNHISYIVRAAVDGEKRTTTKKHRSGVDCYDSPKNVSELTNRQKEAAREAADKIIDIFEELYLKKLWEN